MHRADRPVILPDDRIGCPAAFGNVTLQTPDKPNVVRRIHVNTHIEQIQHPLAKINIPSTITTGFGSMISMRLLRV